MSELVIGWPEGLWIAFQLMGLGVYAAKHGESKNQETYCFVTKLISVILGATWLYWGGFFS